jgi:hypothetical protein
MMLYEAYEETAAGARKRKLVILGLKCSREPTVWDSNSMYNIASASRSLDPLFQVHVI